MFFEALGFRIINTLLLVIKNVGLCLHGTWWDILGVSWVGPGAVLNAPEGSLPTQRILWFYMRITELTYSIEKRKEFFPEEEQSVCGGIVFKQTNKQTNFCRVSFESCI